MRCSIIIRTLNEEEHLPALLRQIREQTIGPAAHEVILVDSGSSDKTLEIAVSFNCRVLHLKRSEFSFGRSLNIGCHNATGDYFVFISGHCVPTDSQWLDKLIAPFAEEKVAITYGRQIGGEDTKFSEHLLFEKYFPSKSESGQAPFFCNNANAAVRRICWEHTPFDETLTGLEDMHLAKRLTQSGWKVAYCPKSVVFHYHREKWGQILRRYEREAIALRQIMPEVHVYRRDALHYFLAGVAGDLARAFRQTQLCSSAYEIVLFRFCQYYGAWRGNHLHRQLSQREKDKYFYPH